MTSSIFVQVELTDFIFAIDNVPALFGVAERGDVFIVFSATVFGLLGLRSAYTVIIRALPHMPYLQKGTGLVLVFVGVRALFDYVGVPLPTGMSKSVYGSYLRVAWTWLDFRRPARKSVCFSITLRA